ncbi:hypothetical protein C487_18086 [Natrinema pallidum DSM 3751]|uniref:Uncharacterized protein n=1 Tax=Natrinema pallidum DSM 3751 TaxID=1227495 RepID=L9YIL7_9EURY|nr:hypothetical protein C487_18086 [Natrinema pallidum DSM 3751]
MTTTDVRSRRPGRNPAAHRPDRRFVATTHPVKNQWQSTRTTGYRWSNARSWACGRDGDHQPVDRSHSRTRG